MRFIGDTSKVEIGDTVRNIFPSNGEYKPKVGKVYSLEAVGGAVKVTIDGHLNVRAIEIAPEVVDPEDTEMLQDLVLTAVNEAIGKAQDLANKRMGALTGGMKIPGLM